MVVYDCSFCTEVLVKNINRYFESFESYFLVCGKNYLF